jgi:hypothetical protein
MSEPTASEIVTALNALVLEHQELNARTTAIVALAESFRLNPQLSGDLNTGTHQIFSDDGEGGGTLRLGGDQVEIDPASAAIVKRGSFPESREEVTVSESVTLNASHDGITLVLRSATGTAVSVGPGFVGKVMVLNPLRETVTVSVPDGSTVNGSPDPATLEKGAALIRRHSSTEIEVY